jgi:hypothetical protein
VQQTLTLISYFIMALALPLLMRLIEHKLRRSAVFPKGRRFVVRGGCLLPPHRRRPASGNPLPA